MRTNLPVKPDPLFTHEGGRAQHIDSFRELQRTVLTCMLFEDTFYEKGSEIAARIAGLVPTIAPEKITMLASEARNRMQLRHVPLFLLRELARVKGAGRFVEAGLQDVIQRADELSEFIALYWKENKQPLSAGVKRGLAGAFQKFDAYRLSKYNRDNAVKLRDVLFLVHAKPRDQEQADLWKRLVADTLEAPDTWEVALSAGKAKKETFERLLSEGKLGGLAALRNLRNMQKAGVDDDLIRSRLSVGIARALPFRFVTAARYAPTLEDAIETAMFKGIEGLPALPGKTGLLIDVSGSMEARLNDRSETTRIDAAGGLAILLREKATQGRIATFSDRVVEIPPRRGFALRDTVANSQAHSGTYLARALDTLRQHWTDLDRLIIITDEQSADGISAAFVPKSYLVNVAPHANGVGYRDGYVHIDGWSDRVLDYIREIESADEKEA